MAIFYPQIIRKFYCRSRTIASFHIYFFLRADHAIVLSYSSGLQPFASGSRSGVRRTVVTPEEILPFVYICVYVYACPQHIVVVVVVVGRLRYMRSFFFPLPLPPCAAAFSDLSLTRPFCFPLFSSLSPFSWEPSFALSRHRVAHTPLGRRRSEGTELAEDRKDNALFLCLSSLSCQSRIRFCE